MCATYEQHIAKQVAHTGVKKPIAILIQSGTNVFSKHNFLLDRNFPFSIFHCQLK